MTRPTIRSWLVRFAVIMLLFALADRAMAQELPADANVFCPVMPDRSTQARFAIEHDGQTVYFCCGRCPRQFRADPARFMAVLDGLAHAGELEHTFIQRAAAWLGRLHPMVVHFPVALLLVGAAGEVGRRITGLTWLGDGARLCLWTGMFGAAAAVPLGWLAGGTQLSSDDWVLAIHRWLGTAVLLWAIGSVVLMELHRRQPATTTRRWGGLYLATLLIGALLVAATGHFGGMLVHGTTYLHW